MRAGGTVRSLTKAVGIQRGADGHVKPRGESENTNERGAQYSGRLYSSPAMVGLSPI